MRQRMRDRVLDELIGLNPNGFRVDRPPAGLVGVDLTEIADALEQLQGEGLVSIRNHHNASLDRKYQSVTLVNPQAYPIRDTITISGREYPRMLAIATSAPRGLQKFSELSLRNLLRPLGRHS